MLLKYREKSKADAEASDGNWYEKAMQETPFSY